MIEMKCGRCGRPLKSEESKSRGYGSRCAELMHQEPTQQSIKTIGFFRDAK